MGDLLFYGERGIVNGIVLDIKGCLEKQKMFFRAIRFADGSSPTWCEQLVDSDFLVEPALSQFGHPDLIAIARSADGARHVVFIEAKVCSYQDAAVVSPKTFRDASKINLQLALKYRFAKAYGLMPKGGYVEEDPSAESMYRDKRRRIKNRGVLAMCGKYFGKPADFLFVALTNDPVTAIPYDDAAYVPPISEWDTDRIRFGLLTYDGLEKANIVNRSEGYYGLAAKGFLGLPADTGSAGSYPLLNTINRSKWSPDQTAGVDKLVSLINTATGCPCVEYPGSVSYQLGGITVAKICTHEDGGVVLALRNDGLPEDHRERLAFGLHRIGAGKNARGFACAKLGKGDDALIEPLAGYASGYIEKRMALESERDVDHF